MKINLPVSQVENPFPHGKYLVSNADLKGTITCANDAFVDLSGFAREELAAGNQENTGISTLRRDGQILR